jgi:hypothetical protein
MRKYLTTLEAQIVLKELHERVAGSLKHFAANITTKKILDAKY